MNMPFVAFLRAQQERLGSQSDALKASGRTDEANHIMAARNIMVLCEQLLATVGGGPAYEAELQRLGDAWRLARETAREHGDFARVAVEESKLAALANITARYHSYIKEDTP